MDGSNPGVQFQVNFPPEANAGARRLTYWLTDDEDMTAEVELALGPSSGLEGPVHVLAGVFVDGIRVATVERNLSTGTMTSFSATVDHASISDGAHSVALLSWTDSGVALGTWSFTIVKNGYSFPSFADAGDGAGDRQAGIYDALSGRPIVGSSGAAVSAGVTKVEAVVDSSYQECPNAAVNVAILAILDGAPVQLSGQWAPVAVTTARAAKALAADLVDLPPADGHRHYLMFMALPGFHQYAEAPPGSAAPWHSAPYRLGIMTWGP